MSEASVTDPLFTSEEYRAVKGLLDDSNDELIDAQAISITRFLERVTGQFYGKDAEAVTRRFLSSGGNLLRVDRDGSPGIAEEDGLSVTVEGAGSPLAVRLWPLNAPLGSEPRPWTAIERTDGLFPSGKIIHVEAVWGWPEVPAVVKEVAIELLAIWRVESPRSTGQISELEGVVAMSTMAASLVKKFVSAYTKVRVA